MLQHYDEKEEKEEEEEEGRQSTVEELSVSLKMRRTVA
jgi:hypothetical protein